MKQKTILIVITIYLLILSLFAKINKEEVLYYKEKTLEKEMILSFRKEPSQNESFTYTVESDKETQIFVLDESLQTIKWIHFNKATRQKIIAQRENIQINITIQNEDKIIENKKITIDELPWYQLLEVSLSKISDKDQKVFWILRPSDLKAFKLKAKREKEEVITIGSKQYEAFKVVVSVWNMPQKIWSSSYWFDKEKVTYIRYEGKRGIGNTPKTIVEIIPTK